MADLDIDMESLQRGATELDAAKENVRAVFEEFQGKLESFAEAFGGDEIGMLLGVAHQACMEAAMECFTTNLTELEDYAGCLREFADSYQAAEDEIVSAFSQFDLGD